MSDAGPLFRGPEPEVVVEPGRPALTASVEKELRAPAPRRRDPAAMAGEPAPAGRGAARAAALGLGLGAFLAVALTLGDPGVTWDEPDYLESARLEVAWMAQVPARVLHGELGSWTSADTVEAYWHHNPYNNPHPPFYKVLAGATWAVFHDVLGDFPAFRLSSAALFGILIAVVCAWGTSAAGGALPAGVGSALALALMPRVFGDAHIAATDMPLATFWTLAAWFFWRAVRGGRRRDVLLFGACWGMALATKFNGILLPVPLCAWGLAHGRRKLLRPLVLGGAVALALRVALDPFLWPDPIGRLLAFVHLSTTREAWAPIATFYLGRAYRFVLPWHHSVVMTLATVPLPLLVLAATGAWRGREPSLRPLVSLCLIQIVFYQALMALPSSPNHDGVRLFLPQFPFLALLAGVGFAGLWEIIGRRAGRPALERAAACALAFGPPVLALADAHPFELEYYAELAGGPRGAYARGFETTYWWDAATPRFLAHLDRDLPPGAHVWVGAAPYHFQELQDWGLLRRDLVFTSDLPAPFLILQTRQGLFGPFEWRLLRDVRPVVAESYHGVPLMALYRWD